eukprot:scaffold332_cov308-Pavlova_lutheri.AAC.2
MPFKYYHGKTGVVWNVTKRAVGVELNKLVRERIDSTRSEGMANEARRGKPDSTRGARNLDACGKGWDRRKRADALVVAGRPSRPRHATRAGGEPHHQETIPCPRRARAAVQVQGGVPEEEGEQRRDESRSEATRRTDQGSPQEAAQRSTRWFHAEEREDGDHHGHPLRHRQGGHPDLVGPSARAPFGTVVINARVFPSSSARPSSAFPGVRLRPPFSSLGFHAKWVGVGVGGEGASRCQRIFDHYK